MRFRFVMKKYLFTLLSIAGEMKCTFVPEMVGVKRPIKNVNKPEQNIETSMLKAKVKTFIEELLR